MPTGQAMYHTLRIYRPTPIYAQEPTAFRMVVGDFALKREMNRRGCVHKLMRERENSMKCHHMLNDCNISIRNRHLLDKQTYGRAFIGPMLHNLMQIMQLNA